jgi:hypothetical protein
MCVQALPAILSAVGAGVQHAGQQRADRERSRIATENLRRNVELGREAGARVSKEVQAVADSTPDDERQRLQDDFMSALKQAQLDGSAPGGNVGATSDRFGDDTSSERAATSVEARRLASNAAAIDAPAFQRMNEGRGVARAATDLSLVGDRGAGMDFLDQLKLSRVGPNAGQQMVGAGLQAFGSQLGGRAQPTWNGATGIAKPVGVRPVRPLR